MKTRNVVKGYLWQKWDDIPDYKGYYRCSTLGKVKSLERVIKRNNGRPLLICNKILTSSISNGYLSVSLYSNKIRNKIRVHQLVSITFLGHKQSKFNFVIDHIDGNKTNNHLSNLRIVTNRENTTTCFRKNIDKLSSKYVGISWNKKGRKWQSFIRIDGDIKYLGNFDTELEASNAYQKALFHVNNKSIKEYLILIKPVFSSNYKGVTWDKDRKKCASQIWLNNKREHLGRFDSELEAYEAYKNALLKII